MARPFARLWHSPTLTTWASLGARTLDLSVVLPLVLARFGAAEVSAWYLFLGILGLQLVVASGFDATFVRLVAYATGARGGDDDAGGPPLDAVVATMRRVYAGLALAVAAVTLALGTWAVARPIGLLAEPERGWAAWAVLVATSPLAIAGSRFAALLQGIDQVARYRRWEAACILAGTAGNVLVLAAGGGLLALVCMRQAIALTIVVTLARLAARSPELARPRAAAAGAGRVDRRVFGAAWPAAWRSTLGVAMSVGLVELSGVLFAQFGAASEVAAYLLAVRLTLAIQQVSSAPFYSRLPRLARFYAEGRRNELVALAAGGMRGTLWVFVALAVGVGAGAAPALAWLGSDVDFVPQRFWAVFALAFFAERWGAMHLQLYSTTNRIVWHVANGVGGAVALAVALAAFPRLGLDAVALGALAGHFGFYCWFCAGLSHRTFELGGWRFERTVVVPPLVALLVYVLASVASGG